MPLHSAFDGQERGRIIYALILQSPVCAIL
jgi:hypothetical protein